MCKFYKGCSRVKGNEKCKSCFCQSSRSSVSSRCNTLNHYNMDVGYPNLLKRERSVYNRIVCTAVQTLVWVAIDLRFFTISSPVPLPFSCTLQYAKFSLHGLQVLFLLVNLNHQYLTWTVKVWWEFDFVCFALFCFLLVPRQNLYPQ